jgi:uncharacterized integral membrane protein (TIGR00698 family)
MQIRQSRWQLGRQWLAGRAPGLLLAVTVAAAASFSSVLFSVPVMLMALLIGIALNFASADVRTLPGLTFASRPVLQVGVALLGLGVSVEQVIDLGSDTLLLVIGAVLVSIGSGWALARLLGRSGSFGILAGGATGICGASAALAISSALPPDEGRDQQAAFVIVVVTALSTLAMVVYPLLALWLGFDDRTTGILLGATIHDVAQVVGAGYGVSKEAGDTATVVKLFRVALLLPAVLVISFAVARSAATQRRLLLPVPLFAIAFAVLALVNSLGLVPEILQGPLADFSRACLVVAVAAIGLKTSLRGILRMGPAALAVPVGATIILLALVVAIQLLTGN